jgi:hypothetical protein
MSSRNNQVVVMMYHMNLPNIPNPKDTVTCLLRSKVRTIAMAYETYCKVIVHWQYNIVVDTIDK